MQFIMSCMKDVWMLSWVCEVNVLCVVCDMLYVGCMCGVLVMCSSYVLFDLLDVGCIYGKCGMCGTWFVFFFYVGCVYCALGMCGAPFNMQYVRCWVYAGCWSCLVNVLCAVCGLYERCFGYALFIIVCIV